MKPGPLMTARALLVLVSGLYVVGCESCSCGASYIAELVELRGPVERDHAARQNQWETASQGETFGVSDGLRTGAAGTARVELDDGATMELAQETMVRFLDVDPSSNTQGIDVLTGSATIEAVGDALRLQTQVGLAIIDRGGRLRLTAGADHAVRFEAVVGQARIEAAERATDLVAGQAIEVSIGGALIESIGVDGSSPDAGIDAPSDASGDAPGEVDVAAPSGDEIIAVVTGRRVRIQAPGADWENAAPGTWPVLLGSRIQIPPRSDVVLTRGGETARLAPGEYIAGPNDGAFVRATEGRLSVQAEGHDVIIALAGGSILARGSEGGSRADLAVGRQNTQIVARRGTVAVRGAQGREVLRGGETATLERDGVIEVGGRGPEIAHLIVTAGESFTVRDPRPPTAIGFRFANLCSGEGVVQLMVGTRARASSQGVGKANLLVPPGSHRYAVRCVDANGEHGAAVAQGTARVMRDSGMQVLPRRPPSTLVDADGRRYRVLYQNQLPEIIARWPNPPSGRYVLHLTTPGNERQNYNTTEPRYAFQSGDLAEGTYRLYFSVAGSESQRSRETTLEITFDNAAPTASVREPSDGGFAPGATVRVSGAALDGWRVTVQGTELDLDRQHRFSGQVVAPADQAAIAIRLSHPGRGVHYYIRRAGGPSP